jgi:hypothetical protein
MINSVSFFEIVYFQQSHKNKQSINDFQEDCLLFEWNLSIWIYSVYF